MPKVSPQAVVHPKAQLADDVEVGPFCTIGPHATLGAGCKLISHVVVDGHTTIGRDNIFYPFSAVGCDPQDRKYKGEASLLVIGNSNCIREHATIHKGTEIGGNATRVGDNNLIMINCHLAHDVHVGSYCILANNVMLAGHVVCGDGVNMGGSVGVHHFVTIGEFSYIGGLTRIRKDVPPFVKIDENERPCALNKEGLQRAKFSEEDIEALQTACRRLFRRTQPMAEIMKAMAEENGHNAYVKKLLDFLHRRDLGIHGRYLEGRRTTESLTPPALR
jgi:UDP-N-acetylglucosamine acyltransferase